MTEVETHLALVGLARDILKRAQYPADEVCVAVVEALSPATAVLDPIVRGAGGHFIDLREVARHGVASPSAEIALHQRIADALGSGSGPGVQIRADSSGLLRAFYSSSTSQNPAEDLVLAAGTAALSPAFAQGGLVVIAYDETGEEVTAINRIWTFLRRALADIAADGTTLVLLCASDYVDYPRMCGQPPAGRLFVQGPSYLKRNSHAQDEVTLGHLAVGHGLEHLVLFLGAGFSVSSGLALGNELRDIALREYMSDQLSPPGVLPTRFYEALAETRMLPTERGRPVATLARQLTLERVLRELTSRGTTQSAAIRELESKHIHALNNPGASVRHLHRMLNDSRRKLVLVTVNFDQLIEHEQQARVEPFITDRDFERAEAYISGYLDGEEDKVPLLKVHGSLERPESLVFNLDATAAGLPPNRVAAVESAIRPRHGAKVPLLYVGASMRDQDLTPLLGSPGSIDNTDEYWASPLPTATVEEFWDRTSRVARWRQHGLYHDVETRFVTMTADAVLDRLADALAR